MEVPPPLIAVEGAPVPVGMQPAWLAGYKGVHLRVGLLPSVGKPRGSVLISTGRTESLEKYFETAREASARGFVVLLHDWRGQGLSQRLLADRLRGHADGFDDFLSDYSCLLAAYEDRLPKPWVMVGHSMGGTLNLIALARGERRVATALLCAPMLRIQMSPVNRVLSGPLSRLLRALGRGGNYVMGQKTNPWSAFAVNRLTHDPIRFQRANNQLAAEPRLNLGGPTWGWLASALAAMAWLRQARAVSRIGIPVTILSAEADLIVENAPHKALVAQLPYGRLVTVPGAFHEIMQETDARRAVFWAEFDALAEGLHR